MHRTNLRKVGGSIMMAIPPAVLEMLDLRADSEVGMSIEGGHLVVGPLRKPRYTLDELLKQCDSSAEYTKEELEWINMKSVGNELP